MRKPLSLMLFSLLLVGCNSDSADSESTEVTSVPWVRTVEVTSHEPSWLKLSGTVRGRHEVPVAFQIPGRILRRHVDAGEPVEAGQLLFELDKRDLLASVRVAEAELEVAKASLAIARSELTRQQQLVERKFVSQQTLERFELALQEALSRRDAAQAVLAQARNALSYAELTADRTGVLAEVNAEPGQVVMAGESLATLIEEGALEVEVYLASRVNPPQTGVLPAGEVELPLSLRELAGAADPDSRSWRARYRIEGDADGVSPGQVVQVLLDQKLQGRTLTVPVGALDERSAGPQVWQVVDGRAEPIPVEVLALESDQARVRAPIAEGSRIIALGTHLLTPGMAVQELPR